MPKYFGIMTNWPLISNINKKSNNNKQFDLAFMDYLFLAVYEQYNIV